MTALSSPNLTGYPVDDILYQDCRFLQGEDRQQPALEAIREAVHSGKPCRQILRNYRKDGSVFWNELSITPVFNEADQLTYFIGIQKNVTEQVEAQQRVVELEAELATARAEIAVLKK
jgi:PAS domain S-box-containing protein